MIDGGHVGRFSFKGRFRIMPLERSINAYSNLSEENIG